MKSFSEETRRSMLLASNGFCQCNPECVETVDEFDHIVPNTKPNNKLFPLFLHSPFNCCPINRGCHQNKGKKSITLSEAKVYEEYLRLLKGGDNEC